MPEPVTLTEFDAELGECAGLIARLDPLGNESTAGGPREVAHTHDQCLPAKIAVYATVHAIARRAGVARATIYLRWPGHDALISAALRHAIGREPYPLTGDIETDLRRGVEQIRAVLSEPLLRAVLPALIREFLASGQRYDSLSCDTLVPNRRRVAAEYRRDAAAQGFRADLDGEVAVDLVIGPLINQLLASGSPPTVEFARQTADVVIAGLRQASGP